MRFDELRPPAPLRGCFDSGGPSFAPGPRLLRLESMTVIRSAPAPWPGEPRRMIGMSRAAIHGGGGPTFAERFHQWDCGGKQTWFPARPFGQESDLPKTRTIERESVRTVAPTGRPTRTRSTRAGAEKEKPRAFGAAMACPWTIVMRSWPARAAFAGSARSIIAGST